MSRGIDSSPTEADDRVETHPTVPANIEKESLDKPHSRLGEETPQSDSDNSSVLLGDWTVVDDLDDRESELSEGSNSTSLSMAREVVAPECELYSTNSEPTEDSPRQPLDVQEQRRLEQQRALEECGNAEEDDIEDIEPIKMIRKGAVAALGGTMVGVGLVMIPLPTPFGAVIASSGMAVLGTEFEGAREMNDKIIDQTKIHMEAARDKVIRSIESMDVEDDAGSSHGYQPVLNQIDPTGSSSPTNSSLSPRSMNEAERKRQEALAHQQQQGAGASSYFGYMRRHTGAYLSRNVLPLLKRTKQVDVPEDGQDGSLAIEIETAPHSIGDERK